MRKQIFALSLSLVLAVSMTTGTVLAYDSTEIEAAQNSKTATVNGEAVTLDVPVKNVNQRIMLPVRFIAENMGLPIEWNSKTKQVLVGEDKGIIIPLGAAAATVNGKEVKLDSPAIMESGRVLVPARFVSESLGADVNWDNKTKTATIEYSDQLNKAVELYGTPAAGEEAVVKAFDYDFGWKMAEELAAFGSAKDGRGFRLVGTPAAKEAADFAAETFKEIGLTPEYHTFKAKGWTYNASSMKIKGHEDLNYFITSEPYTPATAKEGLTAEIVNVGTATKEEMEGVDLTGKVALAQWDMDLMPWYNDIEFQVKSHGAVGLIYYSTSTYGVDPSGNAEFVGTWSGTNATIPVWSMRLGEGQKLTALADKETLTATLISDCTTDTNATGYNVMAKIPGTKYPNEFIIIESHTDGYFHCFQDDALPVGMMMAMAKAMVDSKYQPDRTILFVTTDGEESGGDNSFYDWLQGAWNLIPDKTAQLGGKIVDVHIFEMVGMKDSTKLGYASSDTMNLFSQALVKGINETKVLPFDASVDNGITTETDGWAYSYYGTPTSGTPFEEEAYKVYHSSMDTPEQASMDIYKANLLLQTAYILRMDKQAASPYDLAENAQNFLDLINPAMLKAQGLDGSLQAAAESYLGEASALLDKNLEISKAYAKAQAAKKDLADADKLIASYNNLQRQAVKTVIQGTQYLGLDTSMPRTVYYQYLPERFDSAINSLKAGKGAEMLENFSLDDEDLNQWSTTYIETLENDTWHNTYLEALAPEKATASYWATGRLMKYYDVYDVLDAVSAKIEAGNKDFTAEIAELTKMKADAKQRLQDSFKADSAVWAAAKGQLPLKEADAILKALEAK